MIRLEKLPSSTKTIELANELWKNDEIKFYLFGLYYEIFLRSDGDYECYIYESEEDLDDEDVDSDEGGICTGGPNNAIGMFLPTSVPTGNGGKNDFYDITEAKDLDDLAVLWNLDPFMANELKTLMVNVGARHAGTTTLREAKKAMHYAERRVRKEMLLKDFITFVPDMEILAEIVNEQSSPDKAIFLTHLDCWNDK